MSFGKKGVFVYSLHRLVLFLSSRAWLGPVDCSVTRSPRPASPPTRVTRLGGFTEIEAAKLGADREEKAGLNCGWDLGGAGKQPAVEVSGSCWGG